MPLRNSKIPSDTVHHPLFARFYARFSVKADRTAGWRPTAPNCSRASPAV